MKDKRTTGQPLQMGMLENVLVCDEIQLTGMCKDILSYGKLSAQLLCEGNKPGLSTSGAAVEGGEVLS